MRRLMVGVILMGLLGMVNAKGLESRLFHKSDLVLEHELSIELSSRLQGEDTLTTQRNGYRFISSIEDYHHELKLDVAFRYDSVYGLEGHYDVAVERAYQTTQWVNEAYYRWMGEQTDITVGYQKVVWGQADDLRVVDVVNPLELKDFVLFDLEDYRISQPMVQLDQLMGEWELSVLWLLSFEPNQLPVAGSEFDPNLPTITNEKLPQGHEYGLRAYRVIGGMDFSFYYFNGYNDMPLFLFSSTDVKGVFQRETLIGVSGAKPVRDVVWRYELAHTPNKGFNSLLGRPEQLDLTQWLLGLDYLYRNWLFTAQYQDHRIHNYSSTLIDNQNQPLMTLFGEGSFLSNTVTLRLGASYGDFDGQGGLYQLKLNYNPNPKWSFDFNLDFLSGSKNNFFGQFRDKDRAYVSMTYSL